MTTTTIAPLPFDISGDIDRDVAVFAEWTGSGDFASRVVARLRARGLTVEWCSADDRWQDRREDKVGCFARGGLWKHREYTAHLDLQGLADDGTEVIVRVRASRLGANGRIRTEVIVGAYVGGGVDACGRNVEPRFLCDSRNAPEVAAARRLLGLA